MAGDLTLQKRPEFLEVFSGGERMHAGALRAFVRRRDGGAMRIGFAISARAVPLAVCRNRLRRRLRETVRARRAELPSMDMVISARGKIGKDNLDAACRAFNGLVHRLAGESHE